MKYTCSKLLLEKALHYAERFTGKNVTLPILGNILIDATEDFLEIRATNLEYAIQIYIPGTFISAGNTCVPIKTIYALVQSLPEEIIVLEEKNKNLIIKTLHHETRIHSVSSDDFPLIPRIKIVNTFTLQSNTLINALKSILPAVSLSEFKPELGGVFCNIAPPFIRFAATDTFRLAEKTITLNNQTTLKNQFSFILPYRTAQELVRIFNDQEEVTFSLNESQIIIETKTLRVTSRIIEGMFPDYSSIIPKNFETTSFVNRGEFLSVIRGASVFSSKLQDITFTFFQKEVEVSSMNIDIGAYKTKISSLKSGRDVSISFNHHYFLDGLQVLNEGEFFIGINHENTPALIRNKEDNSFMYVLMPIRLT